MNANFLPISLNIANEKILIVGGGSDALKKIKILKRFGAQIDIVAPKLIPEIEESGVTVLKSLYHKKLIKNYVLVYSCVNNEQLDRQIVADCIKARVLVNVHDKPGLCQFVSPAIYKQGNITIAVGSNGENVFKAIEIRDKIKQNIQLN